MSSWCEEQRILWIVDMLHVYGFINRKHLQRKFGISEPQASIDLKRFVRTYPGLMRYDLTRKCYVRRERD